MFLRIAQRWERALAPVLATLLLFTASDARSAAKNGVSAQSISLPSGPGSIEGLGESFEPQLNTGTATYSVRLKVPPGRAGFAPGLGLSYNGGAGNGTVGLGWSLSGIDCIQRQTDKGQPQYDESETFSGTDVFLVGGEELVPLSDGTFRPENESGFQRYRFDRATDTWLCENPDGSKLTLGGVANSRVSDGARTARWCVSREQDTNGNRIDYEYVAFPDSPGQIYPKRIVYNRHATQSLDGEQIVVFQYEAQTRPDPVSDYRFAFEVITARRLIAIDTCTRGGSFSPVTSCDAVGEAGAARVGAYRLDYDEVGACEEGVCARGMLGNACVVDVDCVAGVTRLERITQIGDDGVTELPPLRFTYTELELFQNPEWIFVAGFPLGVIGGPESALVDLNGDSLPDVVESPTGLPGTLRRFMNEGPDENGVVSFALAEVFAGPQQRLSTPGTQIVDINGDGVADLVTRPSADTSTFEVRRGSDAGFFNIVPNNFEIAGFNDFAVQGFDDPKVQFTDLDFDKRIDIVRSDTDAGGSPSGLRVRINRQFAGQEFLDLPVECAPLPGVDFANGKSFLVDLNGDRLLDVVQVETTPTALQQIRFFPSCGGGGYGRGGSCEAQGPAVTLGGAPVEGLSGADFQNFSGFRWQDLTNDGLSDLLWTGPQSMTAWINVGGDRLRRVELGSYLPGVDFDRCDPGTGCNPQNFDLMLFADINANGTTDIVHVDRETQAVRYLDIVGPSGVPPNLLKSIDNGLGRKTAIEYEPSTSDYLEAQNVSGKPWETRAPFPVTVVSRKRVRVGLDLDEVPGEDEYVTDYRYRDAFYDSVEKEFRGFSEVEVLARGDAGHPTLLTRHSFHTGAPDGEDNDGDGLIDERTPLGGAEEESLKGVALEQRTETCTDGPDGDCFATGEIFHHNFSRWEVRNLHGATGLVCSGDPGTGCCSDADCASDELGGSCVAGGISEPGVRPEQSCANGKSVRWAFSGAERSSTLEQGSGDRIDIFREMEYDDFGNGIAQRNWGIVDAPAPTPFGCVLTSGVCFDNDQVICGSDADCTGLGACSKRSSADAAVCAGNPFVFANSTAWVDERFENMSFGVNVSDWLLRCNSEATISDANATVHARVRKFYDNLPQGQCTQGNLTRVEEEFFEENRFIPRARHTYDAFGNTIETLDARDNLRSVEYDEAFATFPVAEIVHLDGYELQMTADYHEGFGVVTGGNSWSIRGETPGPRYDYGYDTFARITRTVDPGDSDAFPTRSYEYHLNENDDGINFYVSRQRETTGGGTIETRHYVDGLGRALGTKEEGDAADQWIFSDAKGFNLRGTEQSSWLPYFTATPDYEKPDPARDRMTANKDELGRPVETLHPDGSTTTLAYRPLIADQFDENDTSGRTPGAFDSRRNDGLARLVEVIERNPGAGEELVTRYHYDARHNLLEIEDAHANRTLMTYDALSRRTLLNDPNRGRLEMIYDDTNNVLETRDAKDQRVVMTYDRANRMMSENYLDTTGNPATDPVDVRYHFDRPVPGGVPLLDGTHANATFTAGLLSYVEDLTGEEHASYDERRRVRWTVKAVRHPVLGQLVPYKSDSTYDAYDRLVETHYPDGDRVKYEYGNRGLQTQVSGPLGGLDVIRDVAYRPSGQTETLEYGNGVVTEYEYDERLRLIELLTRGAGATLGDELIHYGYTLDPVSNLLAIDDLRTQVAPSDPMFNSQDLVYDDLHRLASYELVDPDVPETPRGSIHYAYDKLGNMLSKTSDIVHDGSTRSLTNLGDLEYGGAAGRFDRTGRDPTDPPGPHALTQLGTAPQPSLYEYDANGNLVSFDGLTAEWDFKDRLVAVENDDLRAEYLHDHSDRRIAKKVTAKRAWSGFAPGETRVTLYPNPLFEIRDGEQPTKFVFLGPNRVAEITGSIDPNAERVQWLPLFGGWNLIALAVDAADAADQIGIGSGTITDAFHVATTTGPPAPVSAATPLPAGSVLWLNAAAPTVVAVRGDYVPPAQLPVAGSGFAPVARLEPLGTEDALPESAAWIWDPELVRWRVALGDALAGVSDFPPILRAGSVPFLREAHAANLTLPPDTARIRYYHTDHIGSATLLTDGAGALVEETVFYPFGEPRVRMRRNDHGLPSSNYLFMGKERDYESGLSYFGARFYAPSIGVFASVDPVNNNPAATTEPRRRNAYRYGLNNPLRYSDPTGLDAVDSIKKYAVMPWGYLSAAANAPITVATIVKAKNYRRQAQSAYYAAKAASAIEGTKAANVAALLKSAPPSMKSKVAGAAVAHFDKASSLARDAATAKPYAFPARGGRMKRWTTDPNVGRASKGAMGTAGKVVGGADVVLGGIETYEAISRGDEVTAVSAGVGTAASAAGLFNPIAGAFSAGYALGRVMDDTFGFSDGIAKGLPMNHDRRIGSSLSDKIHGHSMHNTYQRDFERKMNKIIDKNERADYWKNRKPLSRVETSGMESPRLDR